MKAGSEAFAAHYKQVSTKGVLFKKYIFFLDSSEETQVFSLQKLCANLEKALNWSWMENKTIMRTGYKCRQSITVITNTLDKTRADTEKLP